MLEFCPDTLKGKRDRALLALGFAGAFRRSELLALMVEDLTETPDGLRVLIRRSKTDQEGEGQEIAIPRGSRLRPVEAVQAWLEAAEIDNGPVFRAVALGNRVSATPLRHDGLVRMLKQPGSGGRPRSHAVRRALAPQRVPHQRGRDRSLCLQDDGGLPPQIDGHPERLCTAFRPVQGSRWDAVPVRSAGNDLSRPPGTALPSLSPVSLTKSWHDASASFIGHPAQREEAIWTVTRT